MNKICLAKLSVYTNRKIYIEDKKTQKNASEIFDYPTKDGQMDLLNVSNWCG